MSHARITSTAVCTVEEMVSPHTRSGTHKLGVVLATVFLLTATACTSSQSDVSYPDTTATAATNTTATRSAAPAASVVQTTTTTRPAEPRSTITLFAQGDIIPVPPNPPSGLKRPTLPDEVQALESEVADAYEEIAWALRLDALRLDGELPDFLDERLLEPYRSAYISTADQRVDGARREPGQPAFDEPGDFYRTQVSLSLYEFGISEVIVCSYSDQIWTDRDGDRRDTANVALSGWRLGLTEAGEWGLVAGLWYEEPVEIDEGESCWDEEPFVSSAPVY